MFQTKSLSQDENEIERFKNRKQTQKYVAKIEGLDRQISNALEQRDDIHSKLQLNGMDFEEDHNGRHEDFKESEVAE